MNLNPIQQDDFNRRFSYVRRTVIVFVATMIFWVLMLGLLTSPAWVPSLVERFVAH